MTKVLAVRPFRFDSSFTLIAILGLYGCGLLPLHAAFDLTLLHTNDLHSRIEAINKYDSTCSVDDAAAEKCLGGFARLKTAVDRARQSAKTSLLLDGGDVFQGSLFYTHYKGRAAAEFMNAIGYDAMTVGNHEFDNGPWVLASFVDSVEFPLLLANAEIDSEPLLAGRIKKSVVLKRDGKSIGLIGLTPVDTGDLSSPGSNIQFNDPVVAVRTEVEALKAAEIDIIIVLSHSGYQQDLRIASQVDDVDVIVGGHSNTLLSNTSEGAAGPYPTMVGNTAIVQAYAYGKYLGVLNVRFNDQGVITDASGEPVLLDAGVAEDVDLASRIKELATPLETIREQEVATAATTIDGSRDLCRVSECSMGNLIADALLDRVKDQGVSIAIQNGGGIRASIDAGVITMGEVLTVLPFQNTLATFELSGADIVAVLESAVSQVEEGKGRFPQIAGMKLTWTRSTAPGAGRVKEVQVEENGAWVRIDSDKSYTVVSNNFLRSGGDGYEIFVSKARNAYDFGPGLENVLADYLKDHSPYTAYTDGRIVEQ